MKSFEEWWTERLLMKKVDINMVMAKKPNGRYEAEFMNDAKDAWDYQDFSQRNQKVEE